MFIENGNNDHAYISEIAVQAFQKYNDKYYYTAF